MIGTSACRLRRPASKVPVRSRHAPAACTAWCSTWLWQPRAGGGPPRAAEAVPTPSCPTPIQTRPRSWTRRPQPQAAAWRQHSPSAACSRPSQRHSLQVAGTIALDSAPSVGDAQQASAPEAVRGAGTADAWATANPSLHCEGSSMVQAPSARAEHAMKASCKCV